MLIFSVSSRLNECQRLNCIEKRDLVELWPTHCIDGIAFVDKAENGPFKVRALCELQSWREDLRGPCW